MARVLVVLPTASYRTTDFVAAADRMGVELAVASEEDPPLDLGDRFVRIDCSDPEAAADRIVDLADRTPIDAVIAVDDAGVMTAALASHRLGLIHHPPEAAARTRDKLDMRRRLAGSEVPQPDFQAFEVGADPAGLTYPIVVKPRSSNASQGVVRVDFPAQLADAVTIVEEVRSSTGETGPLLAERYVDGQEVAVEAMVLHGELKVLATFSKPDRPTGPTFPETILVTPAGLSRAAEAELIRVIEAGVTALDLRHGPVHAEAIIDPKDRVHLLEVAARPIGGLCSRSLRFGLGGTSLEELILEAALGGSSPQSRQPVASGVVMLHPPGEGTVTDIRGAEEARAIPGVSEVDITVTRGERVRPLPYEGRYLGFVFATGADADEVTGTLREAAEVVEFVVDGAGF